MNSKTHHDKGNFRSWAYRSFCELIGVSRENAARLIGWGTETNRLVQIPVDHSDLQSEFKIGIKGGHPFVQFDKSRSATAPVITQRMTWSFDVISAIGWLLGGYEEHLSDVRDKYGRWSEANSIVSTSGLCDLPAVNIWVISIREFLKSHSVELIPLWPGNKKYAVVLSHDVDNPSYRVWPHFSHLARSIVGGSQFGIRHALLKLAGSLVVLTKDCWMPPTGVTTLISKELDLGVASTIFLSGLEPSNKHAAVHDPLYDVAEPYLCGSLTRARETGHEIGLHASINTAPHVERYAAQCAHIQSVTDLPVVSNRHHYYNVSRTTTADALTAMYAAGIKYDSSVTFYGRANFRRSIAFPFSPFHPELNKPLDVLELPVTFMDGWLSKDDDQDLSRHVDQIRRQQGLAVLNWHANRFNNRHYKWQGARYLSLVEKLVKDSEVWLGTVAEIGAWWEHRRAMLVSG